MLRPTCTPDPSGTRPDRNPGDRTRPAAKAGPNPSTHRGAMIGLVAFKTHRDESAEAILDVEGRWHCPKLPVLNRVLNILFAPNREARGGSPFGHGELDRVASWIKNGARVHRP